MKNRLDTDWMEDPLISKFRTRFEGPGTGEPLSFAETKELFDAFIKLNDRLLRIARISDSYQSEVKELVTELETALKNVKTLKGLIPICASCKKIRNHDGEWKQLEQYMSEHSDAMFSHGLCPECGRNYRALARGSQSKGTTAPAPPSHFLDDTDMDDPVIVRFLPAVTNPHYTESPLFDEFSDLFQKYVRLTKRMKRIIRISDSYQSELRDLQVRLEHASRTDYLTGLCNRKGIYEKLEAEQNRSRRHDRTFAVLLMDIDQFKLINDVHGHEAGDRVLVSLARLFAENLRKEDSSARWGGEEFLFLFPEVDAEGALHISEKLRKLVAELSIEAAGTDIRLTASFGIALYRPEETLDECIRRADQALYQAKRQGRNRSLLHSGRPETSFPST